MKRFLMLSLMCLVLAMSCTRKPSEEMMTLEESSPAVSLPEIEWSETLVIEQPQGVTSMERTLWTVMENAIVQSLGQSDVRIMRIDQGMDIPESAIVLSGVLKQEEQVYFQLNLNFGSSQSPVEGSSPTFTQAIDTIIAAVAEQMKIQASPFPSLHQPLDSIWVQANAAFLKSDYERTNEAVADYKSILQEDSTFTPALNGLAACYLQIVENRWSSRRVWLTLAQQVLVKSAQLYPDPVADVLMGRMYLQMGDLKKAEEMFRNAVAENPSLDEAWASLGDIYSRYGLYKPAASVYEKALEIKPADTRTRISLAMIQIGFREYPKAERILRKGIILKPSALQLHAFLGLSLYYQNHNEAAEDEINEALKGALCQPLSHSILAMIQTKEGRFDDALNEVVMDVDPYVSDQPGLRVAAAAVYALIGQKGQAIARLQNAVDRGYSEYPWILNDPNFSGLKDDPRFVQFMALLRQNWETSQSNYSMQ